MRAWPLLLICLLAALAGTTAAAPAAPERTAVAGGTSGASVTAPSAAGSPGARPPAPPAAKARASDTTSGVSSVVYPAEEIALRFDHRGHLAMGLTCVFCHARAAQSREAADRLLPDPARCDACHGTGHARPRVTPGTGPASDCAYCHVGYAPGGEGGGPVVPRTRVPTPNLVFDHAAHTTRGVACTRCHSGEPRGALWTRSSLPSMRSCVSCHRDGGPAAGECRTCHPAVGARIKTTFEGGKLVPPAWMHGAAHGPGFAFRHQDAAAADSAFCASCHAEQDCTDCHDGRVRPRNVHPGDWLSVHPIAARQNDPACASCHRAQSFCVSCHQRTGVALSGPSAATLDRGRFHPPARVWTAAPRTAQHHAWEAERNLSACVSCHTERDCATCHATAGRGGRGGLSPHPAGFVSECRGALARNPRPCLYCHDGADPSLSPCR